MATYGLQSYWLTIPGQLWMKPLPAQLCTPSYLLCFGFCLTLASLWFHPATALPPTKRISVQPLHLFMVVDKLLIDLPEALVSTSLQFLNIGLKSFDSRFPGLWNHLWLMIVFFEFLASKILGPVLFFGSLNSCGLHTGHVGYQQYNFLGIGWKSQQ